MSDLHTRQQEALWRAEEHEQNDEHKLVGDALLEAAFYSNDQQAAEIHRRRADYFAGRGFLFRALSALRVSMEASETEQVELASEPDIARQHRLRQVGQSIGHSLSTVNPLQ